jgi:hypothetical protein
MANEQPTAPKAKRTPLAFEAVSTAGGENLDIDAAPLVALALDCLGHGSLLRGAAGEGRDQRLRA